MRIQHNITAMNAYRNYNSNTSAISKNLEKLSSGYKINRAGDDAAGLAVSEKMRLQISGLEQAQKNAKSGISLVQTAEGALTEVHDMLNRMYTIAEQSANGTFDEDTDRAQLQKELESLKAEIERIGKTANFNGIGLFKQYGGIESTASEGGIVVSAFAADENATEEDLKALNEALKGEDGTGIELSFAYTHEYGTDANDDADDTYEVKLEDTPFGDNAFKFATSTWNGGGTTMTVEIQKQDNTVLGTLTLDLDDYNPAYDLENETQTLSIKSVGNGGNASDIWFAIGAEASDSNKLTLGEMSLSLDDISVTNNNEDSEVTSIPGDISAISVLKQDDAWDALDAIKTATNAVSDMRGTLGATQNRLDHTIKNLSVMQENMQDAESVIRDTDIAEEMMEYTKNNILVQSAQAMLAQANQLPQGVLQLLQ